MADDLRQDSIVAAELALGLLEGEERTAAERRLTTDPAFGGEVDRWQRHFATWFGQSPDVIPPASSQAQLLAMTGTPANDNAARPWKIATGLTGALAAGLALLLVVQAPPSPELAPPTAQRQVYAAALTAQDGVTKMPAVIDMPSHSLRMPSGLDVPSGKSAQLWLIVGKEAPRPIGILTPSRAGMTATIPTSVTLPAGSTIAISIEPSGGSPTGAPTGPVVASGTLTQV